MIKDIKELNFPAYATLETASAMIADMGDRTITSQVKIDGDVVPDFSYDWEVEFKGERYIHPVRTPQGTKDNTSRKSKIDLVFHHWAIYEMKRQYFVEMASTSAGSAIVDKYIASLGLNLGDFVTAFNLVLNHYFGRRIVIKLNPEWQYDTGAKFVSISYSYIWDVLQQTHEIYGVRWTLKTNADGVCEILMGYPAEEVSHIFEYGFEGGLLSVQRQVQSTDIRNRLLGRGGSKNLPYRYFKDMDPNNPLFEADPDWIPELANIAFTELRGKTFRDYVKGWKAKRYGGTPMAEPTEAYLIGYNADKFNPIEYVDDKESIEKYGVLVGALENNEGIYPSIQGAPGDVDMVVDAEQVTDDDVDSAVENDSVISNIDDTTVSKKATANETIRLSTFYNPYFEVPEGKVGNIEFAISVSGVNTFYESTAPVKESHTVIIYDKATSSQVFRLDDVSSVVNIPAGSYRFGVVANVNSNCDEASKITLSAHSIKLYCSTPDKAEGWKPTFDIWVRNIWGSSRNAGETDQQYADRVWLPILGDRMGNEARVVFASGRLSFSSDWEFPIVGYAYDNSKAGSEWRLTLAKSEAELEASGKYIPYEGYNASAGDRFFFIGIDMPYQYVLWGEERVDDYKRDRLLETARINPSWVIKTDKVRLNQDREGAVLVNSLNAGSQIRLASKQFISGAYESLYVQSMTYNWTSDTILYPDIEIVVSDKVYVVKNPITRIQDNIVSIQKQIGSISNIHQIIRQVCDTLYLRKDGIKDISLSPTEFRGLVSGQGFRQGNIGGAGWGFYRDANGRSVAEVDKLVVRNDIEVNNLVVNEVTHIGGEIVYSMANMICSAVEETENGYRCFFDQKQGTIVNLFAINDIVWCQKFEPDNTPTKYYKRIVTEVSETYIVLSKSPVDGNDIPSINDNIIHFGNTTNKDRQSAIIINPRNGGSITIFAGIDSFDITDRNYVGMGVDPVSNKAYLYGYGDMFFGDRMLKSNFIAFQNGKMNINADVTFGADSTGLSNLSEWRSLENEVGSLGVSVQKVQDQVDGVVENWNGFGTPTFGNEPAVNWITNAEKIAHINDTYINIEEYVDDETTPTAGQAWRWCQCGESEGEGSQTIIINGPLTQGEWVKVGQLDMSYNYNYVVSPNGKIEFAYDQEIMILSGPPTYIKVDRSGAIYLLDNYSYFAGANSITLLFEYADYTIAHDKDGNLIKLHWHPIADSDAVRALKDAAEATRIASDSARSNLIADSSELIYTYAGSETSVYGRKYLPITVNAGEQYTFKCELAENLSDDGVNTFIIGLAGTNSGSGWISNYKTVEFGKNIVVTFTINDGIQNVKADLCFYKSNAPRSAKARFSRFSLVKGTTPMPVWEDYQGDNGLKNLMNIYTYEVLTIGNSSASATSYNVRVAKFKVKAGERYIFRAENAKQTAGTTTGGYNIGIRNADNTAWLSTGANQYIAFGNSNWATLTIANNIEEQEGYLQIYSGQAPNANQKTIELTRPTLVKGTRPMMVWKENTDYLTNAFKNGSTKISGGLVMAQAVMVEDESGTVRGMLNGSDWAKDSTHGRLIVAAGSEGALASQLAEATTRIYEKGKIISKDVDLEGKITATSGSFTGSITATSFSTSGFAFGNAKIDSIGYHITNSVIDKGVHIEPGYIEVGTATRGYIGSNRMTSSALIMGTGMIEGLRPRTRDVSSGDTLTELDHNVFITGGTIYLPSSPLKGQTYKIYHTSTTSLTINGNGKTIKQMRGDKFQDGPTAISSKIEVIELVYGGVNWFGTINRWD